MTNTQLIEESAAENNRQRAIIRAANEDADRLADRLAGASRSLHGSHRHLFDWEYCTHTGCEQDRAALEAHKARRP